MLLSDTEITVAALLSDIATQRSARNQLEVQLMVLNEGLKLQQNPLERRYAIRTHTVSQAETLPIISMRLFNSPDYWQAIATANGIEYPYVIYPGMILTIPEIS